MVVAGAGSGKTRVLVHRIARLIQEQKAAPHQIMAVTFTNKASQEMRDRLRDQVGPAANSLWMGTFHSLCHRILRREAEAAGLPEQFQIIDTEDAKRLIKRLITQLHLSEDRYEPKPMLGFISHWKEEGKRSHQVPTMAGVDHAAKVRIYQAYENACTQMGLVDFSELLLRCVELFEKKPEVLSRYQGFKYILVDEFQDTNSIQYLWIKRLLSKDSHITVVGDDDQSIYGWRGAKAAHMQLFLQEHPGTEVVRLEQNYRSSQVILKAANALIEHNQERLGKELWTDAAAGEKIQVYGAFDEIDEARYMVSQIQSHHRSGGSYNDVAILYRSNAQSRALEQSLRQSNIPYVIYGGLKFFERSEIKDVLAYIRLMAWQHDDPSFDRVVNVPPRGVGAQSMLSLRAYAADHQQPLWEASADQESGLSPRAHVSVASFKSALMRLKDEAADLGDLLSLVLKTFALEAYYASKKDDRTQSRLENIQELHNLMIAYAADHGGLLSEQLNDFLAEAMLQSAEEQKTQDDQAVKLMTLHAAKGLEFPWVFVGGLEEGLFPHHMCTSDPEKLEEERRLCYVGITRAQKRLFLTHAMRRAFLSRSPGASQPSRFLGELPQDFLERVVLESIPSTSSAWSNKRSWGRERVTHAPPAPSAGASGSVKKGSNAVGDFQVGQRVTHPKFGLGVVLGGEGEGTQARIQVAFKSEGPKWLVLRYARLEGSETNGVADGAR